MSVHYKDVCQGSCGPSDHPFLLRCTLSCGYLSRMVLSVPEVTRDSDPGHLVCILFPSSSSPEGSVLITAMPEKHETTLI